MDNTIPQETPLKQCTKCEEFFPATTEFFYAHKNRTGLSTWCKMCTRTHMNSIYVPHPMTEEKEQARLARLSESLRNSEKARFHNEQLADSRRGKPRKPFADPEQHSANMSKALKGKKHNVKARIKFQGQSCPIQLDLPVFDGCEPKDYTEVHEIMSIYAIINAVTGKMYIGSAVDTKRRWYKHRLYLEKGEHHSIHLQRAWNKYGAEVFSFRLLEIIYDMKALTLREQYWIDHYQVAERKYGYNISPTAGYLEVAQEKASRRRNALTPEVRAMGIEKLQESKRIKLTEDDVVVILERLAQGESVPSIARCYSVTPQNIYGIKHGKNWKHVFRSQSEV